MFNGNKLPSSCTQPARQGPSALQLAADDGLPVLGIASSPSSPRSDSPTLSRRRRHCCASLVTQPNISYIASVLAALCAGSISTFSLYGHLFQERLHYSQYQVNGVAIVSSFALYLPVPTFGYVCDRVGPAPLAGASAILFGVGYALAAVLYRRGQGLVGSAPSNASYGMMAFAFLLIGMGTCALYICSVTTCAKNFGKSKHRGLALALPIAAIGLSGMWQSQVGSRLLYETMPDGTKGDVNVFFFFLFLSALLFVVGIMGTLAMKVMDEQDMIDEAVESLERSGLLNRSALFTASACDQHGDASDELDDREDAPLLNATKNGEEEARIKKKWVLNAETRRFLCDHTMWLFAAGFFLMAGPGETFINNMGTVIETLNPPAATSQLGSGTSAATHVSIVCAASTVVRLLVGALTDLVAPTPATQYVQLPSALPPNMVERRSFSISRVSFLLFFAMVMCLGLALLASGLAQKHGERFWIVSSLVGAGYGALFSISPIIITMIWGVENFGTNWGIVATLPALGNTLWGLVYSAVYQAGAAKSAKGPGTGEEVICYGTQCYAAAYWAMAASICIACMFVLGAWKGRNGWSQRGVLI